jgi:hypothetical protein
MFDFARVRMSTAPDATANYFTESDLPFETTPAFFRPEVLLRTKRTKTWSTALTSNQVTPVSCAAFILFIQP